MEAVSLFVNGYIDSWHTTFGIATHIAQTISAVLYFNLGRHLLKRKQRKECEKAISRLDAREAAAI